MKKYFKDFSNKNYKGLEELFADNVLLIDWDNNIKGKKKVLNFNKILLSKNKIKVRLEEIFYSATGSAASCKIIVSVGKKKLNVIDVIYFNKKMKIYKILAYLR